ncbi:MAG: DUF2797 domain-containing protein [Candidatus Saccharibacteria bacterium]|nr:MAG: DUF2797 domain-containing protein [Candidatus Saccharibacteria bacterium]
MAEVGTYLLTNVGFDRSQTPCISLQKDGEYIDISPLGKTLTLRFDTSSRFCVGWRDITTGERFTCPDNQTVESKYEQCSACQKRTGFNPAFYNATSVSDQQEARNLEPHLLYLAHFGQGTVKVGISHAARGNSRLLEQGARSAIILETFPSAHIARQYEAKIAALPGIAETIQLRKKIASLSQPYDTKAAATELLTVKDGIEKTIGSKFQQDNILHLDDIFFPSGKPALSDAYDCTEHSFVSGKVTGMLGSVLFCDHQDTPVFLPLKKLVGYPVTISESETTIPMPARQISLF